MKKIKYLILLTGIAGCILSCSKNSVDDYDADKQLAADTIAIRKYVTDNKLDFIKDKYGVFYQIINPGTETVNFTSNTNITIDYSGKVMGSTTNFDSSNGTPRTFALGGLIAGWQIGVPYLKKGGKIRLLIPSVYGYQNKAQSSIPANSILDFNIELIDAK